MNTQPENHCLLTFDIEEWFQVENLKGAIRKSDWESRKSSVNQNTAVILDILNEYNVKGTFFVLGWIAERYPELVEKISRAGHEVACHGDNHDLTYILKEDELLEDIQKSKSTLEGIIGKKVSGYRAPSFSVDDRVLNILKKLDFRYDSSFNPFKLNKRYGHIDGNLAKVSNGCYRTRQGIYEIPISVVPLLNYNFPIGGGAYFRILPARVFRNLVKRKIAIDNVYSFYLHPWEFEPGQERIKNIKLNYRFRHYYGLSRTRSRFEKFIEYLKGQDCRFLNLAEYVNQFQD
ncbi:MAG: polysaccharide deacetylase family protein [Calditrichia bacterium]